MSTVAFHCANRHSSCHGRIPILCAAGLRLELEYESGLNCPAFQAFPFRLPWVETVAGAAPGTGTKPFSTASIGYASPIVCNGGIHSIPMSRKSQAPRRNRQPHPQPRPPAQEQPLPIMRLALRRLRALQLAHRMVRGRQRLPRMRVSSS